MNLTRFIERPVLSTVISIIVVILGIIGLAMLPITQYPEIAPPTIQVSTTYTGANAQTILKSVITPLEEQINGVENMIYMTSTATNDGTGSITIYFKQGTDPDMASVNVQNRVAKATPLLPQEVVQVGVTTQKRQTSILLIPTLYSDNPEYDETFIVNYARINIIPKILRVHGVGDATAFGSRDYSMRIWLKPDVMANYGLSPTDIQSALSEQNIEAAPGKFGENENQSFQYIMKYRGRLVDEEEFGNIIVRATPNGQIVRMRDVARIELGALNYAASTRSMGKPGVTFAVYQTAGSNATEVINETKKVLAEAALEAPEGFHFETLQDSNDFLFASIWKVIETLIEAFILVFLVVYLFLQDWRSTLIPAIAVPVAIIGTFFFLNIIGFSLNLLTLFALVLAIAIVVDDAIVVVEAVHAKLDNGYNSAHRASIDAMNEISGAIVSITLVMASVFLPVTFIGGTTGTFYTQFGITLAFAIFISALNALTLSPALCALFLKPHKKKQESKETLVERFHNSFNAAFDLTIEKYKRTILFILGRSGIAFGIVIASFILFGFFIKTTPSGLIPNEDTGNFFVTVTLPPASSLERTIAVMEKVDSVLSKNQLIESRTSISGASMISGNGSTYGMAICKLKNWEYRKEKDQQIDAAIGNILAQLRNIPEAQIIAFSPPIIRGFGTTGGFEFSLQDTKGGDLNTFFEVSQEFLKKLNQRPEIQSAMTTFNPTFPQYMVEVDVEKVKMSGLTVNQVLTTLQGYYGGIYASNFNLYGKMYRVMIQADTSYRSNEATLNNIFVKSNGIMAPISEFINLKKVYGPETITRFNLFTSIAVTGSPKPGYSSGDAIKAINEVAKETLPIGYDFEFSGMTREEQSSSNQIGIVFLLCIVFVYFLLSAQYESYILPFAIILSLPLGLMGSFLFARLMGCSNNIYLQISLIMLIGLLAKNAILIVQFAVERRKAGMTIPAAAVSAAAARLRPILMTSFAMIIGLLPLMFAGGVGANGNRSIGSGAVGGMLVGTLLQIFVVPALYIVFQYLQERMSSQMGNEEEGIN